MRVIQTILFAGMIPALFFLGCRPGIREVKVESPDGSYEFTCFINEAGNELLYSLEFLGKGVIKPSCLGFITSKDGEASTEVMIRHVVRKNVDTLWRPVYGEKDLYPDAYHEAILDIAGIGEDCRLHIRAYEEGVAFRYEFPDGGTRIIGEKTEFALPAGTVLWASEKAQSEIFRIPASELGITVDRPLLAQLPDSLFLAIGEAGLVNFARMKLIRSADGPATLRARLDGEVSFQDAFKTPWRFIMAAERPGQILENNYLLLNLNEPNRITDVSWIRPGKVIREVTLTTKGGKACVDFAARHNLQFVEFDAGWYGHENDEHADATTVTVDPKRSKGPLDLPEVIRYADSKGIGIILYVNRRALEKQLDDILPLYRSWGIKGVKYGFVNVGSQEWTGWLHDAVRKAADHQLMVDVHDEYRPTGYSRTYPNLMTQEGIRGNECMPTAEENLILPFTRMLCGGGDYTICYYSSRIKTTHAHQLAASVVFYSPWQFLFWYDRPDKYRGESEIEFFEHLPVVWDDTRVVQGKIGEFITIARKTGDEWYVGSMNGSQPRRLEIPLTFLNENKPYVAHIYSDAGPGDETRTHVQIKRYLVDSSVILNADMPPSGGQAIRLHPATANDLKIYHEYQNAKIKK
jgi:alpha-glucosidase